VVFCVFYKIVSSPQPPSILVIVGVDCWVVVVAMPGSTQRGQVKGGVLQEWRVGSINLKEDRMLIKALDMINIQKRAFATLMKVDKLIICCANTILFYFIILLLLRLMTVAGLKRTSASVCLSVCLSVILSVCPQHNSKPNDLKVLKVGAGNDLWISYKFYGFGVARSKVKVTGS